MLDSPRGRQRGKVRPMVFLRADDNRYLVDASPDERVLLRQIPGGRWNTAARCWQFHKQPALLLAIDLVLGEGKWEYEPVLRSEIEDARAKPRVRPMHDAHVRLDGGQFAIECHFDDRELVKLVPGYRWSATDKRWYVQALPLSLRILEDRFGAHLSVGPGVHELVRERSAADADELRDAAPAALRTLATPMPLPDAPSPATTVEAAETTPSPADGPPSPPVTAPEDSAAASGADGGSRLADVLERLTSVLERLELRLDVPVPVPVAAPIPPPEPPAAPEVEWHQLMTLSDSEPAAAAAEASRTLQSLGENVSSGFLAAAGIAAYRAAVNAPGRHAGFDTAFERLSRALRGSARLENADLARIAQATFLAVVERLLVEETKPARPIASASDLLGLLIDELKSGTGFDGDTLASPAALALLDRLLGDSALAAMDTELADYCRVLHLVSLARAGTRLSRDRAAGLLRERALTANAEGLALVLYVSLLMELPDVDSQLMHWPRELEGPLDVGTVAEIGVGALSLQDRALQPLVAFSVLACIAAAPSSLLGMRERRQLVRTAGGVFPRRYVEFLAVFGIAASGGTFNVEEFGGYFETLAQIGLRHSAGHIIETVLSGAPGGVARTIAERSIAPALRNLGIDDPQQQLLDLVALVGELPGADRPLDDIAQIVEDGGFEGENLLTREQRLKVYQVALDAAVRLGRDKTARSAFDRLVRAQGEEPDDALVVATARKYLTDWKPLRLPAACAFAEASLAAGGAVDEALEAFAGLVRTGPQDEDSLAALGEIAALADLYPEHHDAIDAFVAVRGHLRAPAPEQRTFPGSHVVVVGGHQRQRARGLERLKEWDVQVEWLNSDEAQAGNRLPQLMHGACDFVVINTAYVGHAASGRAEDAARSAGKRIVRVDSNSAGRLLRTIWDTLAEGDKAGPQQVGGGKGKIASRRKAWVP